MAINGLTESEFQKSVIDLAHYLRWKVVHFRTVREQKISGRAFYHTPGVGDADGFPDLILVRDRVIFAELKNDKGRLSEKQKFWTKYLQDADAEYYIWRPKDWEDIKIVLTKN